MRILTVRQPWAWAIIHGQKDVENRPRNIAGGYRGPVAIHVAQADADSAPDYLWLEHADWYRARRRQPRKFDPAWTDRGAIIGVVDLVDVHHADSEPCRSALTGKRCSLWAQSDAHHLVLANPRPLSEPIPFKGALGLRNLPDDIVSLINEGTTS